MIPLLLTLLVISIGVTIAGYLLSIKNAPPKTRIHSREIASYGRRGGQREYYSSPYRRASSFSGQRTTESLALLSSSRRLFGWDITEHLPWSATVVGLIAIFVVGLYLFSMALPHEALIRLVTFVGNPAPVALASTTNTSTSTSLPMIGASKALARIGQLDHNQYNSQQEYDTWAMSACSAAAMTEVLNAYGNHYRVTDVLQVESSIHEITPDLGLLEDAGIAHTVARFGFKTDWGHNPSLDRLISIANSGRPVIVSFPPDRYTGGHLVVVTGGTSSLVYLADSSIFNRHSLTRAQFMNWWEGFYAVVTPN